MSGTRFILKRYGLVLLSIVLATLLLFQFALFFRVDFWVAACFFAAIPAAALGGLGPGLLTLLLGAVVVVALIPRVSSLSLADSSYQLAVYFLAGFAAVWLLAEARRYRQRVWRFAGRKAARAVAHESEKRFRIMADTAPVLIWMSGLDKKCDWFNKPWLQFTGRTLEQEIGDGWAQGVHPDDLQRCLDTYTTAFDAREPFSMEYRLRRHDGAYRWVLDRGEPCFESKERFIGYIGSCTDVTDRKLAEDELRKRESQLSTLVSQAAVGIAQTDLAGRFVFVNEAYASMVGWSTEELLQKRMQDLIHAEDRPAVEEKFVRLLRDGVPYRIEKRHLRADGSMVWTHAAVSLLRDGAGAPSGAVAVVKDITARKRAEESLQHREEHLRLALQAEQAGIWDWDMVNDRLLCSPRFYEMHGADPKIHGENLRDFRKLIHPEDMERVETAVRQSIEKNTIFNCEYRVNRPDGSVRWISSTGQVVCDAQRRPIRILGAAIDITDRKIAELEREILLSSEQEARHQAEAASRLKDEFLATLSHELRTPLNAVLAWAQLLRLGNKSPEEIKRGLEVIERNAKVQTQLISDLLETSRIVSGKVRLDLQAVELGHVVETVVESQRLVAEAKQIALEMVLDSQVGPVWGDPARLQQVVGNLLSNAVKFTPKQGHVRVELTRSGIEAVILVSDTGPGIAPEFLSHLFERFSQADASTTRKHGGLGLGLAIVRHLVELHGGKVEAMSEGLGRGATFRVSLPLSTVVSSRSHEEHAATQASNHAIPGLQGVRVLLVEDDLDSLTALKRVLEESEAKVDTATTAAEGLESVRRNRPHVLISDIGMPGEDGYSLIRKVRALGAQEGGQLPAVALTAFVRSEDRERALRAGFQLHISKPVEPRELLSAVARLAGQNEAEPPPTDQAGQ